MSAKRIPVARLGPRMVVLDRGTEYPVTEVSHAGEEYTVTVEWEGNPTPVHLDANDHVWVVEQTT